MRIMQQILRENPLVKFYINEEDVEEFLYFLRGLNENRLYPSKVHGEYHSEKVGLFAFILAKKENLSQTDTQIIMDAAFYHDMGRENDCEDSFHGLASARIISEVITSDIYKDPDNLNLLIAICENHSRHDKYSDDSFNYYVNYEDEQSEHIDKLYERFTILNKILKDADALDRNRFAAGYDFCLNEKFLRLEHSKNLIALSREINETYNDITASNVELDGVLMDVGTCYHGIGSDFFKIGSILDNGILSYLQLRKHNISGARNFKGGNTRNWVSVVDVASITPDTTGYKEFTSNGINFVCKNQNMITPLPNEERSRAYETGLPYDKSGHKDEKYVYECINKDDITSIMMLDSFANKKIDELSFIYESLDYFTFSNRVYYYVNYTSNSIISFVEEREKITKLLEIYKSKIDEYEEAYFNSDKNYNRKQFYQDIISIKNEINQEIIMIIKKYYTVTTKMDGNSLTVRDIVSYELAKNNFEYDIIQNCGSIEFVRKAKVKMLAV